MQNVIMPNGTYKPFVPIVIKQNVAMLSVVAPFCWTWFDLGPVL